MRGVNWAQQQRRSYFPSLPLCLIPTVSFPPLFLFVGSLALSLLLMLVRNLYRCLPKIIIAAVHFKKANKGPAFPVYGSNGDVLLVTLSFASTCMFHSWLAPLIFHFGNPDLSFWAPLPYLSPSALSFSFLESPRQPSHRRQHVTGLLL